MTSISHRYYLPRLPNHEDEWSIVFVDQQLGLLVIASDWGNFMHWWGGSGRVYNDFRKELLRFNVEYMENKLSDHQNLRFDAEETVQLAREHICTARRMRDISAASARNDWDDLSTVDDEFAWLQFIYYSGKRSFECYNEFGQYKPGNLNRLRQWLKKSWPRLQEALRADVAAHPLPEPAQQAFAG